MWLKLIRMIEGHTDMDMEWIKDAYNCTGLQLVRDDITGRLKLLPPGDSLFGCLGVETFYAAKKLYQFSQEDKERWDRLMRAWYFRGIL